MNSSLQQRDHAEPTTSRWLRGDSVVAGVTMLIFLTVLQRSVGLVRNVWFCRVLEDDELGRWSLAYNFLLLMAPLIVLGLPGSFGRYVERYRQRGQLRPFLWRTGVVCVIAATACYLGMRLRADVIAHVVFGDASRVDLVHMLVTTLILVTTFNFLVELLTSLRLVRFASTMQLASSLGFAVFGILLLSWTPLREEAVMMAYAGGALLAALFGMVVVVWYWRCLPPDAAPLPQRALWSVLLPFAGWIWTGNLFSNCFEVADQFMLKYFSGLPAIAADSLVGQYYSSRVIPMLLISVATMLAGSLLPHLTRDWEAGNRDSARRRLNTFTKLAAITFTVGAAGCLIASPVLFTWALRGKYDAGLAVLPGTLAYCTCYGIGCIAMNYLLCAEKAKLVSLALVCGLTINVGMNYLLAPQFGLIGVVVATIIANVAALVLIFWMSSLAGMRWQTSTLVATALPLSLPLGGLPALAIVAIVLALGWRERWLATDHEQESLVELVSSLSARWHGRSDRSRQATPQA
ncbi:MAG: oligosaccharide flippase family protein [Pirellulaceae bacterium]|nr:oligosaccharide flippase family protein [Pirellulaceae bacterium]